MTKAKQQPSMPPRFQSARDREVKIVKDPWQANVERLERNVIDCPMKTLAFLGVLSAHQLTASEHFEEDYRVVYPPAASRDSTQPRVGGVIHETEAEAKAFIAAKARLRKVRDIAGPMVWDALREACIFRKQVKMGAVVFPQVLERVAREVYGL